MPRAAKKKKGSKKPRLTPMLEQFFRAKEEVPGTIMFFRLGDFFELFFEDAIEASRRLGLTLTQRGTFDDAPIQMAGVPVAQIDNYVAQLLEQGCRVALCDQVEAPNASKGIVKREVTRVLSPGVRLDTESLEKDLNNFLTAISLSSPTGPFGICSVDVSTGDLRATVVTSKEELHDEIWRLGPAELVVPSNLDDFEATLRAAHPNLLVNTQKDDAPLGDTKTLVADDALPEILDQALGLLRSQLASMRMTALEHVRPLVRYHAGNHLVLDATTLRNLEIFRTTDGHTGKGTLFHLVQRAKSGPGARALRSWMRRPLKDIAKIESRQEAIAHLLDLPDIQLGIRDELSQMRDIERIVSRCVSGAAHPKDLAALRDSLEVLPRIKVLLSADGPPWIERLKGRLDTLEDIHKVLQQALVENPPVQMHDGGIINEGFEPEVAELRALRTEGSQWFLDYEAQQRERSGIPSLKVRFNKVFGYYIEVTRTHLAKVPEDYIRKQTIANGERYFTPELKEMEAKILNATGRLIQLEQEIFAALRSRIAGQALRIQHTAVAVATLDAITALADLASESGYVKPKVHDGDELVLIDSRHPTLELLMPPGEFVPNDIKLGGEHGHLMLITGPNMAGKSTVMRQVALTSILAQMGAWIPAGEAHIGLVDRVFTRVGASDSITTGRSTFMVEMVETSEILAHATDRSLILLDEIGRGTATFDGLSIAWAVAEDLHDRVGGRTMFATHYHELCDLSQSKEGVRNAHIAIREWEGKIIFLRRLKAGPMRRSYGIEVGNLAGLPQSVVSRAREVLDGLECDGPQVDKTATIPMVAPPSPQMDLFSGPPADPRWERVLEVLEGAKPDSMTPKDALLLLYDLRELL